jgi:hypothetical protein
MRTSVVRARVPSHVPEEAKLLVRAAIHLIKNSSGPATLEIADAERIVSGTDWRILKEAVELLTGRVVKKD